MSTELFLIALAVVAVTVVLCGLAWSRRIITDPAYYEMMMTKAAQATASGQTASARKLYTRIVAKMARIKAPTDDLNRILGNASLALGDLEMASNDVASAVNSYRRALELVPVPLHVLTIVADSFARTHATTPEAVQIYIRYVGAMRGQPALNSLVMPFLQSLCEIDTTPTPERASVVISYAEPISAADPDLEWTLYALGRSQGLLGQRERAISTLQRAEQLVPTRAATPYHLGVLYSAQGQSKPAYAALKRSLALDPNQPDALYRMARMLVEGDRPGSQIEVPTDAALSAALDAITRACELSGQTSPYWHLLGRIREMGDNLPEACLAYRKASTLDPQNFDYQYALAQVTVKQNDVPVAIMELQKAAEIRPPTAADPRLSQVFSQLGDLLYQTRRFGEAVYYYRRVLDREPSDQVARLGLANSLYEQETWADAIKEYEQVQALPIEALYKLGRAYGRNKMPHLAADRLGRYRAADQDNADAWYWSGVAHSHLHEWSQAQAAYEKADSLYRAGGEELASPMLYLGTALMAQGKMGDALVALEAANRRKPGDGSILYARGLLAHHMGRDEDAHAIFASAIHNNPNHAPSHFGIGMVQETLGDYEDAATSYRKGIELNPNWSFGHMRLGVAHAKAGHWDAARSSLLDAATAMQGDGRRGPGEIADHELLFYLGLAEAKLGDHARALSMWNILRKESPNDVVLAGNCAYAYYMLGQVAFSKGDYQEAVSMWDESLRVKPGVPEVLESAQEAFFRMGADLLLHSEDSDEVRLARQHLERANNLRSEDPRVCFYLGLLAMKEGDTEAAVHIFGRLVERMPGNPLYAYHLAISRLAQGNVDAAAPILNSLAPYADECFPALELARGAVAVAREDWPVAVAAYSASLSGENGVE